MFSVVLALPVKYKLQEGTINITHKYSQCTATLLKKSATKFKLIKVPHLFPNNFPKHFFRCCLDLSKFDKIQYL